MAQSEDKMTEQFSLVRWWQAEVERDRSFWWVMFLFIQLAAVYLAMESAFISNFIDVMQKQVHPVCGPILLILVALVVMSNVALCAVVLIPRNIVQSTDSALVFLKLKDKKVEAVSYIAKVGETVEPFRMFPGFMLGRANRFSVWVNLVKKFEGLSVRIPVEIEFEISGRPNWAQFYNKIVLGMKEKSLNGGLRRAFRNIIKIRKTEVNDLLAQFCKGEITQVSLLKQLPATLPVHGLKLPGLNLKRIEFHSPETRIRYS